VIPGSRRGERLILTPEHVPIRLSPAGLGSRFLALITDVLIVLGTLSIVSVVLRAVFSQGVAEAFVTTASFVLFVGYPIWFELRHQGRTPGKRAFGLRVVDGRGLPIRLEQSFVRNIVRALDFAPLFYGVGGLVSLFDRDRRRLGDILADTLVVHERIPLRPQGQIRLERRFNALRTPSALRRIRQRVDLEERSVSEVAHEVGVTPNNATVRLHRARQALKTRLEGTCGACAARGCLDCSCRSGTS